MSIWCCYNCRFQSIENKRIIIKIPDNEADNSSVVQIENRAEIYFLCFKPNKVSELSYVGQPLLIWLIGTEISIQQVFSHIRRIRAWPGTAVICILDCRFYLACSADPKRPLVIDMSAVTAIQLIFQPSVSHFRICIVYRLQDIPNPFVFCCS